MQRYRSLGIKLTPQRLAILECLRGNDRHPSAEDVYNEVRKSFPTMSFATVYNTLEVLRQKGEVVSLNIDPGRRRYDPNTKAHNHVICLRCNAIADVHEDFGIKPPSSVSRDYDIKGSHIEFYGICPKCKQKGGD